MMKKAKKTELVNLAGGRFQVKTVTVLERLLNGHAILHNDRDYEPFELILGLQKPIK